MAEWGFDFVRIPMAYPRYIQYDRTKDVTPDEVLNIDWKVVEEIVQLLNLPININCMLASIYTELPDIA